jgi:cell division septation protein DedD
VWFLYLTRALREDGESPAIDVTEVVGDDREAQTTAGGDSVATAGEGLAEGLAETPDEALASATRADTAGAATGLYRRPNGDQPERVVDGQTKSQDATGADERVTTPPKTPEETVTSRPPPKATPAPSVPADLAGYAGKYLVHVSSFRGMTRAQSDADYLKGRGYNTVIAQIDLGEKGTWYRVYVGPLDSRDDALSMKIRLDENPRVLSTRITRVPIQWKQNGES